MSTPAMQTTVIGALRLAQSVNPIIPTAQSGGERKKVFLISVPENQRTKSKLEACVKAHDLCCYTLQITANKKIFTENYQRSLTDRIVSVAIGIHVDCWNANNIYVRSSEEYYERRRLQDEAARKCNILLSLIDIAKPLFHLASKRVYHWGKLTIEARNMIRAWRDADIKRNRHFA